MEYQGVNNILLTLTTIDDITDSTYSLIHIMMS